ncbi:MAG: EAL domain-containing protein [Planctomycetota bacterium]
MRTQFMSDPNSGVPWIEYSQAGKSPIKQELTTFPFVIGRDESADFRVDSGRVSRRHVAVEEASQGYGLRDLGSTNGTYVNGERITEVNLSDGDVIVVADFELTFFSGRPAPREAATQVMTKPVDGTGTDGSGLVLQVRRLHEALTHRAISSRFQPVVALAGGEVLGYEARCELDNPPRQSCYLESMLEDTECRLAERIFRQYRVFAVEQANRLEERVHLFLSVRVSEVGSESLPDSLLQLIEMSAQGHQLVIQIPETAVCDIPYFRKFIQQLRDRRVQIAYAAFHGSPAQISGWHAVAPDFLTLSPSLVRGISGAGEGRRALRGLIEAMGEIGCASIATGVDTGPDAWCLAELGCQYGQGEYFGAAQRINALSSSQVAAASTG